MLKSGMLTPMDTEALSWVKHLEEGDHYSLNDRLFWRKLLLKQQISPLKQA